MVRTIISDLIKWKNSINRKPLIIRGARQTGKSWVVEHFGKQHYPGKVHIINFEKRPDLHLVFESNFDIKRICFELEILLEVSFDPQKDLIFFDEIQACPKALMSLRYFYEDHPEYHLIAAGSLIDFALKEVPFPVGRVMQMEMYPLTFYEFLLANGKQNLADLISNIQINISESVDLVLQDQLSKYFIVGGMPECVKIFVESNNLQRVNQIQDDLLYALREDYKKYTPTVSADCLNDILNKVSSGVGNQIKYSKLSDRFSGPTIKKGFDLLKTARLVYQVQNVSVAGLPLTSGGIQFKALFLDIGLLVRLSGLRIKEELVQGTLLSSYKGMLAEQFVGQEIIATHKDGLFYWMNTTSGTSSEVDYIIERSGQIIPIEVKFGKSGSLKSLHVLMEKYSHIKQAVVISGSRIGIEKNITFIPLYRVQSVFSDNLSIAPL